MTLSSECQLLLEYLQNFVVIALVDIQVGQVLYGPPELMDTAIRTEHICGRNLDLLCLMCVAADADGGDADTRMNEADPTHPISKRVRASFRGD